LSDVIEPREAFGNSIVIPKGFALSTITVPMPLVYTAVPIKEGGTVRVRVGAWGR
jgi:hypothetical protein